MVSDVTSSEKVTLDLGDRVAEFPVLRAVDGRDAVERTRELRPDVLLMDVRMPVLDGIDATAAVLALPDPPRVLVLTTFDVDDYVVAALRAGASGYLLKDVDPDQLVRAVRDVVTGDLPLARQVLDRLVASYLGLAPRPTDPRLERLTAREREHPQRER